MLLTITEGKPEAKVSAYHYISIPLQVHTDLCAFVDHYDTEVSGCGMVERVEHRFKSEDEDEPDTIEIEFAIREVYLPNKQDNSKASTDIDDEVIAELVTDLLQKGKNTEHLRLHWHSHATMDTFHSGTDEDNYRTLSNGDFLVSLVINKAHRFLGRVDYFKPVRVTLTDLGVHLDTKIESSPSADAMQSIAELDKYVKENRTQFGATVVTPRTNWRDWGDDDTDLYNSGYDKVDTLKEDLEIAKALGIPEKAAIRYRACKLTTCHCCKEADVCQDYLYQIDRARYNY